MKSFVNNLDLQKVRAWACQHGNKQWRTGEARQLRASLINSDSAKEQFNTFYGS